MKSYESFHNWKVVPPILSFLGGVFVPWTVLGILDSFLEFTMGVAFFIVVPIIFGIALLINILFLFIFWRRNRYLAKFAIAGSLILPLSLLLLLIL